MPLRTSIQGEAPAIECPEANQDEFDRRRFELVCTRCARYSNCQSVQTCAPLERSRQQERMVLEQD